MGIRRIATRWTAVGLTSAALVAGASLANDMAAAGSPQALRDPAPSTPTGTIEPAGMTPLVDFDASAETFGPQFSPWHLPNRVRLTSDDASSTGKALEITYPSGTSSRYPASSWDNWAEGYREVYFRADVAWNRGWQMHRSSTNKIWYFGLQHYNNVEGKSASQLFVSLRGRSWPARVSVNVQVAGVENTRWATVGTPLRPGTYHRIEIWLKAESAPDANDGQLRIAVDGVPQDVQIGPTGPNAGTEVRGLDLVAPDATTTRFGGVNVHPIWGGSGDTKKRDDWMRIASFYMSGK